MKPPRRIVDDGDDWAREIIRSARTDVPSEQFRRRLARQLGVAAGAAGVSSVASAKAVAAGIWLKWMAIGATASVLTLGGATAIISVKDEPPNASTPANAVVSATTAAAESALHPRTSPAPPLLLPTSEPTPTNAAASNQSPPTRPLKPLTNNLRAWPVETSPVTATMPASTPSAAPAVVATAAPVATLGEELAAINSVRAALAGNSARAALRALDEYAAKYPNGHFATEALILRVNALSAAGDHASAKRLADDFLAGHPDSPYARRLRSLSGSDH